MKMSLLTADEQEVIYLLSSPFRRRYPYFQIDPFKFPDPETRWYDMYTTEGPRGLMRRIGPKRPLSPVYATAIVDNMMEPYVVERDPRESARGREHDPEKGTSTQEAIEAAREQYAQLYREAVEAVTKGETTSRSPTPVATRQFIVPKTAAQHALNIPEILGIIFSKLALTGEQYYDCVGRSTLLSACLVNATWFNEAVRHLWMNPCGRFFRPITKLLGDIHLTPALQRARKQAGKTDVDDPEAWATLRRQVYAERIRGGTLYAYTPMTEGTSRELMGESQRMDVPATLGPLTFPQLRKVTLYVQRSSDEVPRVRGHQVKVLLIIDLKHRKRHTSCMTPPPNDGTLDNIIDQIPGIFPDLEFVEFGYYTRISRVALMRFCQRLPRLQKLNSALVSFSDDYRSMRSFPRPDPSAPSMQGARRT